MSRLARAERAVDECLNFGGIFIGGLETTQRLSLVYTRRDIAIEIFHMLKTATAFTELADAIVNSLPGYRPGGDGCAIMCVTESAIAAIQFSLKANNGLDFLKLWNAGEFQEIRKGWPQAPESVFGG